jgi:hypothetical protein
MKIKFTRLKGVHSIFSHRQSIQALQIRYWQSEQEDANALRAGAQSENLKFTRSKAERNRWFNTQIQFTGKIMPFMPQFAPLVG